jgi:hypothetical protein
MGRFWRSLAAPGVFLLFTAGFPVLAQDTQGDDARIEERVKAEDGAPSDGRAAVTAGANVWFNGWTRWQIDVVGEHFDGRGNGSFRAGSGWRPTVLSQLQIKF